MERINELRNNPIYCDKYIIHDLNKNPYLPFDDNYFGYILSYICGLCGEIFDIFFLIFYSASIFDAIN
ncbi:MAG: hypothetical protein RMI30_01135 [Thermodesulfovibrio sp.]|nr:hypothetical protein [Thermodesulfovibrio sp.]MDW7998048.1 hypothetical protein [Thermodesulfovibrio sp.]